MYAKDNEESWRRIYEFIDEFPDGWQQWQSMARRVISELELLGMAPLFRVGQSMHHIVFSTLSHHGLELESRVTLEFQDKHGLVRVAYSNGNIHFCEALSEDRVPLNNAALTIVSYLRRLWGETKAEQAVPDVLDGPINLSRNCIIRVEQQQQGADMEIPESMKEELGSWNDGAGIDLETWVSCMGNYGLATGYLTLFWPEFVEYEGYILRKGFSETSLRGFESAKDSNRKSVERVLNHIHIADLHYHVHDMAAEDKIIFLGRALKEIYQAKLAFQFPHSPCIVEFLEPETDDIEDYELSFWQACHEPASD